MFCFRAFMEKFLNQLTPTHHAFVARQNIYFIATTLAAR
jgi:hypothetical protein